MSAIPKAVMAFFAVVLSVIAIDGSIIAYGLLNPRVDAGDGALVARPPIVGDRFGRFDVDPSRPPMALPVSDVQAEPAYHATEPTPRRAAVTRLVRDRAYPARPGRSARLERFTGRDWKKTALVIGGSTAAAAALGAIFGGKKGALIGAAIGGGASSLYESRHH